MPGSYLGRHTYCPGRQRIYVSKSNGYIKMYHKIQTQRLCQSYRATQTTPLQLCLQPKRIPYAEATDVFRICTS